MNRIAKLTVFGFTLAAIVIAADNPFVGTWKLNPQKSSFTGDTMTYTAGDGGEMKYSGGGLSYTFKPDGTERAGLLGEMVAWKQLDDHTWEVAHKTKGKVTATETLKLSDDGKTLDDTFKGTRPNGESFEDKVVYERTSGDSGILGTWKSTKIQIGSPERLELKAYDGDGITFYSPEEKFTASAKFDGKQYPAIGPTVPAGATGALRRVDPLSFELTESYKGKPFWKGTYTVSEDKQTLTVKGGMIGANEPMTAVYDRQ
ncbi:MAG: hypothetical protein WB992_02605 [Bryobacteraceae bacterium]